MHINIMIPKNQIEYINPVILLNISSSTQFENSPNRNNPRP